MKAKYTYESLGDILKPKDEKYLESIFDQYGFGSDLSIRIRKPVADYNKLRLERASKFYNITIEPYPEDGWVPEEESHNDFLLASGKTWNVYQFFRSYYGFERYNMMANLQRISNVQIK